MNQTRQFFRNALEKYPMVMNSVIYSSLCVGAEFSQQTFIKKIKKVPPTNYDTSAMARYAIYGTTVAGPILTLWYRMLDRKLVGTSGRLIAHKLLLDQFFFTPPLLILFFVAMSTMEGKRDILDECKHKFGATFKKSCCFWLPAQAINFILVPPVYRVIYIGACSCAWVNILCWVKSHDA